MMPTFEDVKREFGLLLGSKEDTQLFQLAKTGDGTGADTSDVAGEPGWVWVRLAADQSKVIKVFSLIRGLPAEVPVIIGKPYPAAEYQQIIVTVHPVYHRKLTDDQIDQYTTQRHGESHGERGYDRAPIGLRNLEPARLRQTDPESLSVYVENFRFVYGSTLSTWPGGQIDLTASVPGAAGHRYVLVYHDPSDNTLGTTNGLVSPLAVNPTLPAVTAGTIPLGVVDLEQGETDIGDTDIRDYRQLWNSIGGVGDHTHTGPGDGGASLLCIEEFFVEDLPVVMDGNSLTPWGFYQTLYASGLYAGTQELVTIHPDPAYVGTCPQMILIRPGPFGLYDTYSINVRHGIDNIWLTGEEDILLDKQTDHLLLVFNGEYWCDIGWQAEDRWTAQLVADGVTKTVKPDGTGDFITIQSAIDWFKVRLMVGDNYIDADAGTYNEAVAFSGLVVAGGATLTLRGDTRLLAGLSFVDGATMNANSIVNGGSGTCALANAGANITVTGTVTNPDYDADSWGSGDKILVYDDAGAITEHTIDSVANNVITLTAAAPAIGNDATAIVLLPNRRISRTTAGPCVDATGTKGVGIDGWYLRSSTGANCHGIYSSRGGIVEAENCVAYAEDIGFLAEFAWAAILSSGGATSAWGCGGGGYIASDTGQVRVPYTVSVASSIGYLCQTSSYVQAESTIAVNATTGYQCQLFGNIFASSATARQNTTGYFCQLRGYLYAAATNANNNGNGTDYNPAVSDTFGNSNGSITWS